MAPERAEGPETHRAQPPLDVMLGLVRSEDRLREQRDILGRAADTAIEARQLADVANQAKSDFLASMSHDLRTPLTAIIGITEMLVEELEEEGLVDYLEPLNRVHRAGEHLLALINDVLDLSKIEAGRMELQPERVAVASLAEELIDAAHPLANRKNNRLALEVQSDPGAIYADSLRLKQVVLNLLSNACKFTEGGEVRLSISRTAGGEAGELSFVVSDNGIGMTAEQMAMIFQDFSQADANISRRYGGTGLGLAISRRLARMMNGDISVTSRPGEGSVFTLTVPADTAADPKTAAEEGSAQDANVADTPS